MAQRGSTVAAAAAMLLRGAAAGDPCASCLILPNFGPRIISTMSNDMSFDTQHSTTSAMILDLPGRNGLHISGFSGRTVLPPEPLTPRHNRGRRSSRTYYADNYVEPFLATEGFVGPKCDLSIVDQILRGEAPTMKAGESPPQDAACAGPMAVMLLSGVGIFTALAIDKR